MFSKGQVVFSKCGRDKGYAFVVVAVEDEYVYVVDGRLRLLEKPKKKKYKHVQMTKVIVQEIKNRLDNNAYLLDADIRKALAPYTDRVKVKEV